MRITALAVAAVLLTACPGPRKEDYSQSGPPKTSTTTQNPQAVPENSTAMNPVTPPQSGTPSSQAAGAAGQTTEVQLMEYMIHMPDTLPAGEHTFKVVNSGKEDHSFVIHGGSVHAALPEPLKRGDTRELTVSLPAGTYHVMCPVKGHEGKGMGMTLTVK